MISTTAEIRFDFYDIMEETVSFFTEEYGLSAEEVYLMTQSYAQIKTDRLSELKSCVGA
jgi:hypothetical protein